ARQIRIELRFDRDSAHLTVVDDGRGFDSASPSEGFGLTSMRERAAQIGGALHLESRPLAGTSITVTVPVADRGSAAARPVAIVRASAQEITKLPKIVQRGSSQSALALAGDFRAAVLSLHRITEGSRPAALGHD